VAPGNPGPPVTAQQLFETMMRHQVAPALREMGFRGTYREFSYLRKDYGGYLSVQKSRHSNRDFVDFRIHLTGGHRRLGAPVP
jgi:hypothetical protein